MLHHENNKCLFDVHLFWHTIVLCTFQKKRKLKYDLLFGVRLSYDFSG